MLSNRRDKAAGAAFNSMAAKHTRKAIAREIADRGKVDPLAPVVAACIVAGQCRRGHHTNDVGCTDKQTRARFTCWCGGPNGHDWAGKAEGAPHPR